MSDYDLDLYAWSQRQGRLLRRLAAGQRINDADVDWCNIAEAIEAVARSERTALGSHIATIIEHLIKLQASPAANPRAGWITTVGRARRDVERLLMDNATLRREVDAIIEEELPAARRIAARALAAHGEVPRVEPTTLMYGREQLLGDWFPDESTH